jgi:putative membrane protein
MESDVKRSLALLALAPLLAAPLRAQADLNDLEMAHVAVTANSIDIRYAHLALALSENAAVREFAETMIRDHSAVTGQVAALAQRLNVEAQDNAVSRQQLRNAERTLADLSALRGAAFDRRYVENELAYHRAVNGIVADSFIPNIENAEVKRAFESALVVFRGHERHAARLARSVSASGK